jgi:hypothetical protein
MRRWASGSRSIYRNWTGKSWGRSKGTKLKLQSCRNGRCREHCCHESINQLMSLHRSVNHRRAGSSWHVHQPTWKHWISNLHTRCRNSSLRGDASKHWVNRFGGLSSEEKLKRTKTLPKRRASQVGASRQQISECVVKRLQMKAADLKASCCVQCWYKQTHKRFASYTRCSVTTSTQRAVVQEIKESFNVEIMLAVYVCCLHRR